MSAALLGLTHCGRLPVMPGQCVQQDIQPYTAAYECIYWAVLLSHIAVHVLQYLSTCRLCVQIHLHKLERKSYRKSVQSEYDLLRHPFSIYELYSASSLFCCQYRVHPDAALPMVPADCWIPLLAICCRSSQTSVLSRGTCSSFAWPAQYSRQHKA